MKTFEEKALFIYKHFGEEAQVEKLKEELTELLEAVVEKDEKHIQEETCDFMFVLYQFMASNGQTILESEILRLLIRLGLLDELTFKTDRTLERIESGYYENSL